MHAFRSIRPVIRAAIFAALVVLLGTGASQTSMREAIQASIAEISARQTPTIAETPLLAPALLEELYKRNDHESFWADSARAMDGLEMLRTAATHGLNPNHYHLETIDRLRDGRENFDRLDDRTRLKLELLMTDAMAALAYHRILGRVDPQTLKADWSFLRRPVGAQDFPRRLSDILGARDIERALIRLSETALDYERLRAALNRHRRIAVQGGWPTVAPGPAIKPETRDSRIPRIRHRLAVSGDYEAKLEPPPDAENYYDAALVSAVKRFQSRHNLTDDGAIGKETLAAMNVPVERRIEQIRVNLERARWIEKPNSPLYLITNVAGFDVKLVEGGSVTWSGRVIVGRPVRQSPTFKAQLTHVVFNPTWTVPPTILREDVLPAIRKDVDYLARKNMSVRTNGGETVDPLSIDWEAVDPRNFPYQIVQEPGPGNALGRVKFIFPNEHLVFMHDTPDKNLFQKTVRAFSSGCIRIQDPLTLAEKILKARADWTDQMVAEAVAVGETRTVYLNEAVPVYIFYWTAEINDQGRARFLNDVYGRDKRILDALNTPKARTVQVSHISHNATASGKGFLMAQKSCRG